MFAFLPSLGWQEMLLLLVIGLLLYGRNLPEAGRKLGIAVSKLKRGFDEFKRQIDADADVKDIKRTFQDTAGDLRRARDAQQRLRDPVQAAKSMARDAMLAPPPDAERREPGTVADAQDDAGESTPAAGTGGEAPRPARRTEE